MKSHIQVQELSAFYGNHCALKNVSVEIPEKQITAIIGPSGCGKSTFLKCLNRMIELTDGAKVSGQIVVEGDNILDGSVDAMDVRTRMGLLAQKPVPLPMSIYDNVAYGPRLRGIKDRKKLDFLVEDKLTVAGLWNEVKGRLKTPAGKLSLGQQQRLCLARGLAVDPEIILCDEPTSSLDPLSAQHIEEELVKLKEHYTVVIVTHNIHQAMRIADYVLHFYLGQLIEHGAANDVLEHPRQARTKAYVNGTPMLQFSVDLSADLRGNLCPNNFILAKKELARLGDGQVLAITVDDPTAVEQVPAAMEADGHQILDVTQMDEHSWQIAIQKQVSKTAPPALASDYSI